MGVLIRHSAGMMYTDVYGLLRRLEIPAVSHGYRSCFKDCCTTLYDRWLPGETAVARNSGNATETAYAQNYLFESLRQV